MSTVKNKKPRIFILGYFEIEFEKISKSKQPDTSTYKHIAPGI